jgi:hypothetical protein
MSFASFWIFKATIKNADHNKEHYGLEYLTGTQEFTALNKPQKRKEGREGQGREGKKEGNDI